MKRGTPRREPDLPLLSNIPRLVQRPTQTQFSFEHVINFINQRMDEQVQRLDRIHSGQLTLCAQVKDLRESLPMQRRPLSRWAQQIHIDVINTRRNGLCPCCQEAAVASAEGRLQGAEYDHWYARNRNRAEETWLVCGGCNARLNDTEFKASVRSAFESYQLALRRVIQSRQQQSAFTDQAGTAAAS